MCCCYESEKWGYHVPKLSHHGGNSEGDMWVNMAVVKEKINNNHQQCDMTEIAMWWCQRMGLCSVQFNLDYAAI